MNNMNQPATTIPQAPRVRRVRPGMVQTTDPMGRVWTIEERRDTFGGANRWAWFATCDDDRWMASDPTDRLMDATHAIATIDW